MRFWYPASITQITSLNDSFDSCILSICYAGRNRNKTIISKEAIENAVPTMAYCPIVANYDVESDTIGGHDVGFIEGADGGMRMINLTDAIGVVPENPQWCWQKKTDDDGVEREYLCTPAILWKRTPVYQKLKRDGVSGQSMEINVKDGKVVDGLFEIDAFEFTAFCLLGDDIEPCFEGAQVEMFSLSDLSNRLSEMMDDFKKNYSKVIAASADDNITPKGDNYNSEGGESSLNIEELLQKYGLTVEDVNFETDGMSSEEIERRFAEIKTVKFDEEGSEGSGEETGETGGDEGGSGTEGNAGGDTSGQENGQSEETGSGDQGDANEGDNSGDKGESGADGADDGADDDDDGEPRRQFSLTGEQLCRGIMDALSAVKYTDEWGEWSRYCYVDYDPAINEVYAYDNEGWILVGFRYSLNGDNVIIDFSSKMRKKVSFVDFDDGDAQVNYAHLLDSANAKFAKLVEEVNALRTFKKGVEDAERAEKVSEVFAKFADLADDESFNSLRENCADMSIRDIEDKCFAIRGRKVQVNFSRSNGAPIRLPVERGNKDADPDEPYGGIFVEYGFGK